LEEAKRSHGCKAKFSPRKLKYLREVVRCRRFDLFSIEESFPVYLVALSVALIH